MAGPHPWVLERVTVWGLWAWLCSQGFGSGSLWRGLCQELGLLTCVLFLVRSEAWLTSASRTKELLCCQKAKKWGL